MEDQRKDHIDPEGPKQRNRSKQLRTHNLPTDNVENINITNKEIYYSLKTVDCSLRNRKDAAKDPNAQHIQHIINESKTKRKNLALAWIDYKKAYDIKVG